MSALGERASEVLARAADLGSRLVTSDGVTLLHLERPADTDGRSYDRRLGPQPWCRKSFGKRASASMGPRCDWREPTADELRTRGLCRGCVSSAEWWHATHAGDGAPAG